MVSITGIVPIKALKITEIIWETVGDKDVKLPRECIIPSLPPASPTCVQEAVGLPLHPLHSAAKRETEAAKPCRLTHSPSTEAG